MFSTNIMFLTDTIILSIILTSRYVVNTSVSVENDKWFYYKHTFLQHPDDVKVFCNYALYILCIIYYDLHTHYTLYAKHSAICS
jgi:hypothetical protein